MEAFRLATRSSRQKLTGCWRLVVRLQLEMEPYHQLTENPIETRTPLLGSRTENPIETRTPLLGGRTEIPTQMAQLQIQRQPPQSLRD